MFVGITSASGSSFCNEVLDPDGTPVDVMTLDVPAGSWIATISIQTGPLGSCGGEDPQAGLSYDGDFGCTLEGGVGGGGHPASSKAGEFRTVAWSEAVYTEGWTRVAVTCSHFGGSGSPGPTLSVGDLTLVPVPSVLVFHMP